MYYFFYFPVGTDVACRRRPLVTWGLVAANILAYLLMRLLRPSPFQIYALAFKPGAPSLASTITACFLHADLFHLAGNMMYLALLGGPVEDRLGRARFLLLYLLSGAVAMIAQAAFVLIWVPALAMHPVIGASGAAAGILGALVVRLPHARVRVATATLLMLHGMHKVVVRHIPAVIAVAAWIAIQLAYGLAMPHGHTAYWSHLGGLVVGGVLALAAGAGRSGRFEQRLVRGEHYMKRGAWFAAVGEFESALRLEPGDGRAQVARARALVAAGNRAAAIAAFHKAVAGEIERGAEAEAARLYLELERLLPGTVLEPRAQLKIARALRRQGEFAVAAQALIDFATTYPAHPSSEVARLLAGEFRADLIGDSEGAAALFREVDVRRLSPRWQAYVRARRAGGGVA